LYPERAFSKARVLDVDLDLGDIDDLGLDRPPKSKREVKTRRL